MDEQVGVLEGVVNTGQKDLKHYRETITQGEIEEAKQLVEDVVFLASWDGAAADGTIWHWYPKEGGDSLPVARVNSAYEGRGFEGLKGAQMFLEDHGKHTYSEEDEKRMTPDLKAVDYIRGKQQLWQAKGKEAPRFRVKV
ncbi:MAG TPA: hypothetical protein VMW41_06615 [Candidatus Bathyarchaeia archaeon]|nr:hypothetical protein [Candidatus Bathyarchaeia archaeon]